MRVADQAIAFDIDGRKDLFITSGIYLVNRPGRAA